MYETVSRLDLQIIFNDVFSLTNDLWNVGFFIKGRGFVILAPDSAQFGQIGRSQLKHESSNLGPYAFGAKNSGKMFTYNQS